MKALTGIWDKQMPLSCVPHIHADALLIVTPHSMGILPQLADARRWAMPDEILTVFYFFKWLLSLPAPSRFLIDLRIAEQKKAVDENMERFCTSSATLYLLLTKYKVQYFGYSDLYCWTRRTQPAGKRIIQKLFEPSNISYRALTLHITNSYKNFK